MYSKFKNKKNILFVFILIYLITSILIYINIFINKNIYESSIQIIIGRNQILTNYAEETKLYKDAINMYLLPKSKENLIKESLPKKSKYNYNAINKNLTIDPDIYGREINIKYKSKNKEESFLVANNISNKIINNLNNLNYKNKINIEKRIDYVSKFPVIKKCIIDFCIVLMWNIIILILILICIKYTKKCEEN
ncbi:hypothetical protein [uncultured Clostridium sp.]|uniref:hypothetical protein n=1 Tax=uncultured Clostridium sp. TaxID=59620 RepID=UPI00258E3C21|nr:hypothetical protein [uncultured Clostridium sp.]